MPPKGWKKIRGADGKETWLKTPNSFTNPIVTVVSKSLSHAVWDAYWPHFVRRRKARDAIKVNGKYNPDTKTLEGTWSFLNRSRNKGSPFSYKRAENERDSLSERHPACIGQDMRRLFADVYTSQPKYYNVETLSPIFHGVEAGVKIATKGKGYKIIDSSSSSSSSSSNNDNNNIGIDEDCFVHGFWDGVFDLTLPAKKETIEVEESFEIRAGFGPSSVPWGRNRDSGNANGNRADGNFDDKDKDEIFIVGRGENDFGIFTLQGTYNKSTRELNAIKMYDPIPKKRSRSVDNTEQAIANQVSSNDGRSSKRQRKVSQIIRLREQQELAAKKAVEDAIIEKKKRMEERKLLRQQRREQEKMAAEEREIRRVAQEKLRISNEKKKLEKLRVKKLQDEQKKVEMEREKKEQEKIKAEKNALKITKMEEEIKARKLKQKTMREAALARRHQQNSQQKTPSQFHPMSPLNVSLNNQYSRGTNYNNGSSGGSNNITNKRRKGESALHALIMKQQKGQQGLHSGPISPIYTGSKDDKNSFQQRGTGRSRQFHGNQYTNGRSARNKNKYQQHHSEEIIEEIESDEELDLPDGVPQIIATVYHKPDKNGKLIEGELDFRTALSYPDGEIYEGQFYNGMRHGLGTCIYANGDMYEGEWSEGQCHGEGLLTNEKGKLICQGKFLEGRLNGHATFRHEDGSQYTGEWKESRRHGRGVFVDQHGNKYDGEWRDNVRQGPGMHIGINGSYFDGEWARDVRNGFGYLKLANGTEYEGTWKANRMEGRGTIKYPDGGNYEGNIRLGKKDGRGKYVFPSGAEYEGRFRDDKIDGMGTLRMNGGISFVKRKKTGENDSNSIVSFCSKGHAVANNDDDEEDENKQMVVETLGTDDIEDEEIMIPFDLQKDLATIHFVAGFDRFGK